MRLYKGKLSIIMPAYNEGRHIYRNTVETHRVARRSKCPFELIIVDDGSGDNTYAEAMKAACELGSTVAVTLGMNKGKGFALKEGFRYSTGDFVVFLDADLDLHPEQLIDVFRVMRDERADVIVGSKYHPQSRINYPPSRKVLSRIYAGVLKVLFDLPLRDTQTGMKAFRREVLERVFPLVECDGFAFDIEILTNAHRMGYRVVEAPVRLNNMREMKWGRITVKDMYRMWLDTMSIYYRLGRKGARQPSDDKSAGERRPEGQGKRRYEAAKR